MAAMQLRGKMISKLMWNFTLKILFERKEKKNIIKNDFHHEKFVAFIEALYSLSEPFHFASCDICD